MSHDIKIKMISFLCISGIVLCWMSCPSYGFFGGYITSPKICTFTTRVQQASNAQTDSFPQTVRKRKTVTDRTQAEVTSLIKDIIQAIIDVGPRAAPQRTLQAYIAVSRTVQDFLPTISSAKAEKFSTPLALRKLFERMGATYIKLV